MHLHSRRKHKQCQHDAHSSRYIHNFHNSDAIQRLYTNMYRYVNVLCTNIKSECVSVRLRMRSHAGRERPRRLERLLYSIVRVGASYLYNRNEANKLNSKHATRHLEIVSPDYQTWRKIIDN